MAAVRRHRRAWASARPADELTAIAFAGGAVAFLSASQDIVIDAYRREMLPDNEQGLGSAVHVNAYKVAAWCRARCR